MTARGPGALHGAKVLDLSESIAGQYCCRLLSDYGALVTLLEPPAGSCLRADPSLFFHLNHGKRSAVLEPQTREPTLAALLQTADIVVSGQQTGWASTYPDCVFGVVTPFGQDGAWADWQGSELIYQAMSGVMMQNGDPARAPLYGCSHRASFAAGTALYVGVVAALIARRGGGGGQEVDVSIAEVAASMSTTTTGFAYSGLQEGRNAGDHQLRCRDGWVAVWIYSHLWQGFCTAVGAPELFDDPRFAAADDRQRNWKALMQIVQALVQDMPADALVARLQAHRLIAAKAAHMTELTGDHPHLAARGFWETVATPDGPQRVLGPPFRMGATPRTLAGAAPARAGAGA